MKYIKVLVLLLILSSSPNICAEESSKTSPVKKAANTVDRTAREAVVEVKKAAKTIGSKLNIKSSEESKKKVLKE